MLDFLQPIHPKLVHFPIALFIVALCFELISIILKKESFHKTAWHIYFFAVLLMPIIVRTGIWEEERLHLHHPVLESHEMFALWAMWASLVSLPVLWFMKHKSQRVFRISFVFVLLSIASLCIITAHFGGRLVYEYGVGVQP